MILSLTACAVTPHVTKSTARISIQYAGSGRYTFNQNTYTYDELLEQIRILSNTTPVGYIDVDMSGATTVGEMLDVCRLVADTGATVNGHYLNNGKPSKVLCQQN